jgi:4-diphosphocytidyl-2-C-methyl-D-erythritol kinase
MGEAGGVVTEVTQRAPAAGDRVVAPAKLTVSLQVVGVRPDGLHELRAEMVSLDLADELEFHPGGEGLEVHAEPTARATGLSEGAENLVVRALRATGRHAHVRLVKRIPVQGGLGGGSTDAAAVLRWAGCEDPSVAASLGADVPFCLIGGRALVTGIGEAVSPLPYVRRAYVLMLPPFGVSTAAVYRAWDEQGGRAEAMAGVGDRQGPNDLASAALAVEPELGRWGRCFAEATGRQPVLAGSGSTWFVEGEMSDVGLAGRGWLALGAERAPLLAVHTVPSRWDGVSPLAPPASEAGSPTDRA